MLKLHNNPILFPYQKQFLSLFFATPFSQSFFLTGGTALSAFYLAHRESQDLDFFSLEPFDTFLMQTTLKEIADKMNSGMVLHIRSQAYNEILLEDKRGEWTQKIDIVQEQPKHFGEIQTEDTIRVDSLINIATNKILAIYGRLELKDYIDLYVILMKTDLKFNNVFELAKQKDTGLSEFYFANTITGIEKFTTLPKMKIPFDKDAFVKFYAELSQNLLLKIKPKQ